MRYWLLGWFIFAFCCGSYAAPQKPHADAIASASSYATDAGMAMLNQGGNAFDAAVAVASMLGVTEPHHSGMGGGGFILIYDAKKQQYVFIDARDTAPQAARKNMYLDTKGNIIPGASLNGAISTAIPGTPAGLAYLANRYGNLPLKTTLAPAIKKAKQGMVVDKLYQRQMKLRLDAVRQSPAAAKIFLENNNVPKVGHVIKQDDLANTMNRFAEDGADGFYRGEVAEQLVQGVRAAGGIWTLNDLKKYRIVIRKPLIGHYKDMTIITSPPPSAGGVALITMLNILDHFKIQAVPPMTRMQLIIEAMRRAFWDRANFLGDPAFIIMPIKHLTSKWHARKLARDILPNRATPSEMLEAKKIEIKITRQTTHFSIIDAEGNIVAATLSLNYMFGSGFVPPGTGVLLNDEMDDFSLKTTARNVYGIIGSKANSIAPRKRPLSSMTPTFLLTDDRVAIMGAPGGSRIPTMILLAILDFVDGNLPESWVKQIRYHHQYFPDEVQYELGGLTELQQKQLQKMGYQLKEVSYNYGDFQAILWDKKNRKLYAASDPRRQGKSSVNLH